MQTLLPIFRQRTTLLTFVLHDWGKHGGGILVAMVTVGDLRPWMVLPVFVPGLTFEPSARITGSLAGKQTENS